MPQRRQQVHQVSTRVMSILMIVIGVVLLVRTLIAGGGALATGNADRGAVRGRRRRAAVPAGQRPLDELGSRR